MIDDHRLLEELTEKDWLVRIQGGCPGGVLFFWMCDLFGDAALESAGFFRRDYYA